MDANVILECFSATLQSNQALIVQAELKLKELQKVPGFLGACLDIICSTDNNIHPSIKKASAVYFKNRIVRFWNHSEPSLKVDNDEKPIVRERIISAIIVSDYNTKQQLIPVLRTLIAIDFKKWPGLLDKTGQLLSQVPTGSISNSENDLSQLYTGLLCFSEICRKFRWITNDVRKDELYPIIDQVFPHLLTIGKSIVENFQGLNESIAEILKLILKCYKFVSYYDLPQPLQVRESVISWGEFHVSIINMPPPHYVLNSNISEQEKSFLQISKCYKWSIKNIYRLFSRYASASLSKKFVYKEFHQMFMHEFIPQVLSNFLQIIEQWCSNTRWLCSQALYYIAEFLSHCVTQKSTWALIKPYYETLLSHFIFPLLCPTDDILETFDEEPQEYIHLRFDIQDEYDSPDIAALGLLATFTDKRKSTTLQSIVTFIHTQLTDLNAQPQNLDVAKKIDGILRILGCISIYIIKDYEQEMEAFLYTLVFPLLTSKFDFLKARALDVAGKFADIEYQKDETYNILFHGILVNFESSSDIALPISFQSALAIQAYLSNPRFKPVLGNIILPTMSRLLQLSNEIDNDAISMVMQECVENFSEQLQPFGVDLMGKLVEQLMRLSREINEASNVDIDDFDGKFDDQSDKVMAATGLLNTMITVLLSFENSQETCLKLEQIIYPCLQYILENDINDFLGEIGELIENSTFLLRKISPTMWSLFEYLFKSFLDGTAMMYLEELINCLNNYLIFGQVELRENEELRNKFFTIYKIIMNIDGDRNDDSDDYSSLEFSDLIIGLELAQNFILAIQAKSDPYIETMITLIMSYRLSELKTNSRNVNINNVILSSMIYNSKKTLSLLEQLGVLNQVFEMWDFLIENFNRVYDIKLSILALMTIINDEEIIKILPSSLSSKLLMNLIKLLEKLPQAIESLELKRKDFQDFDHSDTYKLTSEYDNLWENHQEDVDIEQLQQQLELEQEDDTDLNEYEFQIKNSGYFNEEDEQVIEDPLSASPLETVQILPYLSEFLLANQDNQLFVQLPQAKARLEELAKN